MEDKCYICEGAGKIWVQDQPDDGYEEECICALEAKIDYDPLEY